MELASHHQDGTSCKGLHERNPVRGDVAKEDEASSGGHAAHTKAMTHQSRKDLAPPPPPQKKKKKKKKKKKGPPP